MDRRRFMPTAEGLDQRILLSAQVPTNVPVANLHQKTVRIENLGKVLDSLQPGIVIPKNLVTPLQADLFGLVGRLNAANTNALVAAQLQFRSVVAGASISTADLAGLNSTFRTAVESTGAPQTITDDLIVNMNNLVKFDSTQSNSAILAANDYAVILQTVLGVGRPIRRPAIPTLSPTDDSNPKGDHATTVNQPHLVGQYDINTTVHLLDENGGVLGTALTAATGSYSVAPASPLSVGKHKLRIQAFDGNGDASLPSRAITITIRAPRIVGKQTTAASSSTSGGLLGI